MKTNELIKKIEALGYRTCKNAKWLDVLGFNYHIPEAQINTANDALRINTTNKALVKLCIEYAETPLAEREDEKKYTVVLPDPRNSKDFMHMLTKRGDSIEMGWCHKSHLEGLTEAEIKRNHEYLWQFAKEVKE